MNSLCLKLYLAYSISLNSSNVGKLFEVEFLISSVSKFRKRKRKLLSEVPVLDKTVQWRQRNEQKSVMQVRSFCFSTINLLLFCPFSCRRPASLLKLPIKYMDPRGYSWERLGGGSWCPPVLQILTRFQTKKCHFPHSFSDQTSKIHTRFQTWPLGRNYVIIT